MARIAIESRAAPAVQGPLETQIQELVILTMVLGVGVALADPGILLGAGITGLWHWHHQPSRGRRILRTVILTALLVALHSSIAWAWTCRDWLASAQAFKVAPVSGSVALHSLVIEALAGPIWLEGAFIIVHLRRRTVHAQIRRDHRLDKQRWHAISGSGGRSLLTSAFDPKPPRTDLSKAHPRGHIRIGVDLVPTRHLTSNFPATLPPISFYPVRLAVVKPTQSRAWLTAFLPTTTASFSSTAKRARSVASRARSQTATTPPSISLIPTTRARSGTTRARATPRRSPTSSSGPSRSGRTRRFTRT